MENSQKMSGSKHEKKRRQRQLKEVRSDIERKTLPPDMAQQPARRPRTESERQALVEQKIQEAMAEGAFDNLPGQGKPLALNSNPYLEPGQELAYGLLKNNNFAPAWIEQDKAIRHELAEARQTLRRVWEQDPDETTWQAAITRFEPRLTSLNRKIKDFNLTVPLLSSQRSLLRLADEIRRAQQEA